MMIQREEIMQAIQEIEQADVVSQELSKLISHLRHLSGNGVYQDLRISSGLPVNRQ
jgi:hypothetical protein